MENTEKKSLFKNWLIKRLLSSETTREEALNYIASNNENTNIDDTEDNNEKSLIKNILSLDDKSVEDIMVPRAEIVSIEIKQNMKEILSLIENESHSRMPVFENNLDNVLGFLHVKDLIKNNNENHFELKKIIRDILYVAPKSPILDLLKRMRSSRIHIGLVVDEFGGVDGLITIEDLVEEIVGEVRDEFDLYSEPVVITSPTTLETLGSCPVNILQEYVDLGSRDNLPDVETVSGLLMTWLGRPPQLKDHHIHNGNILFTVLSVDGFTATKVCVEFPVPSQESSVTKD